MLWELKFDVKSLIERSSLLTFTTGLWTRPFSPP